MLYKKEFLQQLDQMKNKTLYARIVALSVDELPLEQIEGRITQGSINVDGSSAVRRTCSLTVVADNFDYSNYLWGLNTKFKLEIGLLNTIDNTQPEIIWFNQGVYVITSFSTSRSTTHFTITIQGKDKMCLLNGEVGGTIGVQTDFGTIEEEDADGIWTIRKIPIPDIIKNMVHSYGGEPYHNIIIKDLDMNGLELLEYRYDNVPLILYRKIDSNVYSNAIFANSPVFVYRTLDPTTRQPELLSSLSGSDFEQLTETLSGDFEAPIFYFEDDLQGYRLTKINFGDAAGYRPTELTYAGDLIAKTGESITSVLDKIKNMLVEYEYFYDLDGRFVFQKKESFISTLWNNTNDSEDVQVTYQDNTNSIYTFNGNDLIISLNNNPNLLNVRNDFSIWGEKQSVSGAKVPIHLRYAIDTKPQYYCTIGNFSEFDINEIKEYNEKYNTTIPEVSPSSIVYTTNQHYVQEPGYICVSDWREVLYQMAKDYFQYNFLTNFEIKLKNANPNIQATNKTGYEQYYTDIQVCWRQLYNPEIQTTIEKYITEITVLENELKNVNTLLNTNQEKIVSLNNSISVEKSQVQIDILYQDLLITQNDVLEQEAIKKNLETKIKTKKEKLEKQQNMLQDFYQIKDFIPEEEVELRSLSCLLNDTTRVSMIRKENDQYFITNIKNISKLLDEDKKEIPIKKGDIIAYVNSEGEENIDMYFQVFLLETKGTETYVYFRYYVNNKLYWNKSVFENPSVLNYWFDFLDISGELSSFNTKTIGVRTKAINENNIKTIYYREIPNIMFTEDISQEKQISGYRYIQIPNLENMFSISSKGKSAKEKLDELLYSHGYCSETASLTTIPIYYLEPNTRIHISDSKTKINGDYIIDKISLSLSHNGNMTLTITKAAETIF